MVPDASRRAGESIKSSGPWLQRNALLGITSGCVRPVHTVVRGTKSGHRLIIHTVLPPKKRLKTQDWNARSSAPDFYRCFTRWYAMESIIADAYDYSDCRTRGTELTWRAGSNAPSERLSTKCMLLGHSQCKPACNAVSCLLILLYSIAVQRSPPGRQHI